MHIRLLIIWMFLVFLVPFGALTAERTEPLRCHLDPIHGNKGLDTTSLLGKKYVLQVFAPWCGYCIKTHPMMVELGKVLPVYGIAWREEPRKVASWLAEKGDSYVFVGLDPRGTCLAELGLSAVPFTFIIDEGGKVAFKAPTTSLSKSQIIAEFNKARGQPHKTAHQA